MAQSILLNRAKMTVSGNPGTGAVTLGSAVAGYQTFAAAGAVDQMFVSYVIEQGTIWEIGQGTYTASGTSLARTTIIASSSGGAAVSFNSTALVYIDALANNLTPAYQVDGLPAAAVFSAPKQAFYLNGASVAPTALLNWSSTTKYCTATNGNLYLVSANQPAWDWSSGYERLLIEANAATNSALYSQDFSNAVWATSSSTKAYGLTDPAGGSTACRVTATAGGGLVYNAAVSSGVTTPSIYVRRVSGTGNIEIFKTDGSGAVPITITTSWQRFSPPSLSLTASNAYVGIQISTLGDVIDVAFGQIEVGYVASSYIPTTSAPVTRVADVVTAASGLLAQFQASNMALAFRGSLLTDAGRVIGTDGGTDFLDGVPKTSNLIYGFFGGTLGTGGIAIAGSGTMQHFGIAQSIAAGIANKIAFNGGAVASNSNSIPSFTAVYFFNSGGGYGTANGFVDEIVVWPFYGSDAGVQAQARVYS